MRELEFTGDFVIPSKVPYNVYQEHINRYAFASDYVQGKIVLDVACGTGYGSSYLKRKGAEMVIGGDISKEAIEYAEMHYRREGLSFVCLDATHLPFPERYFDVVVSIETIEHVAEYKRYLSECTRVLKQGGLFICSTPNGQVSPSAPYHINEFDPYGLRNLMEEYFADVKLYAQELLGFKDKIWINIIVWGRKLLSVIPWGGQIKRLLRRLIPSMSNVPKWLEISDSLLDKRYKIVPWQDEFFNTAAGITVVAEKRCSNAPGGCLL